MSDRMEIEVFRAGDYGRKGTYGPDDLRQIAEDYDPSWHEAPVTLDHKQDGPAYGWVESLRAVGDVLIARLKDLHESLREWIRKGAYKKRSIELYRSFGRTGRPYLRAVSFLGACPPEVKGLADPVFKDDDSERVVLEFECDAKPESNGRTLAFVEKQSGGEQGPQEGPDTIYAEVESLRNEAARLAEQLEKERTERRRSEIERFCDEVRKQGRILPAWEKKGLVEFMLALDRSAERVETPDGRKVGLLEWFQELLRSLRPQVELKEAAPAGTVNELRRPAVPQPTERATIRPSSLALHEKAVAYCQQHEGVTYVEALQAVARL